MNHAQHIESLLFYKGEPVSYGDIERILEISKEEVLAGVHELRASLEGRGIVLIEGNDSLSLATHPDIASVLEKVRAEELQTPLSKAALETLTIIAYKSGVTKNELDYIRGVNSQFMVRNLLVRGLIERAPNPEDKRSPLYRPTHDLLAYLGIARLDELPEFNTVTGRIEEALQELHHEDETTHTEITSHEATDNHVS